MDCEELNKGTSFTLFLSLAVTFGTVASYLPQHYRIIQLKSSAGLSPLYMLLGGISSFSTVVNSLILHAPTFHCMGHVSLGCFLNGIIPLVQVTSQWLCFFLIVVLCIVYFPPEQKEENEGEAWAQAKRCCAVLSVYMGASLILALLLMPTSRAQVFARVLGILAVVVSVIQFVPQIWRTMHLRQVGALSIPAMCIQAPGSFVFCLAIALTPKSDWSTWLPYFVGGCLQGTLLVLCLRYRNIPHPPLILLESN